MTTVVLVDHNMEGQAALLFSALQSREWATLLNIEFVRFTDIGLPKASTDREVWRQAQDQQMIRLTANRRMIGPDSLEQTIREENTATSLPILTVGVVDRLEERGYREVCADRVAEIVVDLERYLGVGRLLIP